MDKRDITIEIAKCAKGELEYDLKDTLLEFTQRIGIEIVSVDVSAVRDGAGDVKSYIVDVQESIIDLAQVRSAGDGHTRHDARTAAGTGECSGSGNSTGYGGSSLRKLYG
jgi:hypothetical protein